MVCQFGTVPIVDTMNRNPSIQRKRCQVCRSGSLIYEIQGMDSVRDRNIRTVFLPFIGESYRDPSQHVAVPLSLYTKSAFTVATYTDRHSCDALTVKVLKPGMGAVTQVRHVTGFLIPVFSILRYLGKTAVHPLAGRTRGERRLVGK